MNRSRRVVILWTQSSGYLAAAARSLAARPDVELRVFTRAASAQLENAGFADSLAEEVGITLLREGDAAWQSLSNEVLACEPDLLIVPGWDDDRFRDAAVAVGQRGCRIAMAMDTPFRGLRHALQRRARLETQFRSFRSVIDAAFVPGERGSRFAEALGFGTGSIFRGLYPFDSSLFTASPSPSNDRPSFLFVGQYIRRKGLDLLLDGYAAYAESVQEPWPLTVLGQGPLGGRVTASNGVVDRGFVQPPDQPAIFRSHDVLVLPSRTDAWGVVVAEAAAVGLAILCTDTCGAAADLVRHRYNGLLLADISASAVQAGLLWFHEHEDRTREMWGRGVDIVAPFASVSWPDRVLAILD